MTIDFDQLHAVARGFGRRFPEGNDPFRMMTRLLEECGELAQQATFLKAAASSARNTANPIARNWRKRFVTC